MALQQRISPHVTSLIRFKSGRPDGEDSRPMAGSGPVRESQGHAAVTNSPELCECGHPLAEHAWSGWGENTVCVEQLPDENDGWYGVCPCVRHGDEAVR